MFGVPAEKRSAQKFGEGRLSLSKFISEVVFHEIPLELVASQKFYLTDHFDFKKLQK